jgi:hypothetical protein
MPARADSKIFDAALLYTSSRAVSKQTEMRDPHIRTVFGPRGGILSLGSGAKYDLLRKLLAMPQYVTSDYVSRYRFS